MDSTKRKISSVNGKDGTEDGAEVQTESTPGKSAAVVTPQRKKVRNELRELNSDTCQSDETRPSSFEEEEEEEDEQEDTKQSTKDTRKEQDDEEVFVNGDTVMGFRKHPNRSNKDIMMHDFGFAIWARGVKDPTDNLAAFAEWTYSDEAKGMEFEARENGTFSFGQHAGNSFAQVAASDPKYHTRYMHMMKMKGQKPPSVLSRYMDYLKLRKSSKSTGIKMFQAACREPGRE